MWQYQSGLTGCMYVSDSAWVASLTRVTLAARCRLSTRLVSLHERLVVFGLTLLPSGCPACICNGSLFKYNRAYQGFPPRLPVCTVSRLTRYGNPRPLKPREMHIPTVLYPSNVPNITDPSKIWKDTTCMKTNKAILDNLSEKEREQERKGEKEGIKQTEGSKTKYSTHSVNKNQNARKVTFEGLHNTHTHVSFSITVLRYSKDTHEAIMGKWTPVSYQTVF